MVYLWSRDSSVGIVIRLRAGRLRNRISIPGRDKGFVPYSTAHRSALGSTHPPLHWVLCSFPLGKAVLSLNLTIHPHRVKRLRILEAIPPIPHTSPQHGA
jgi:hypothetical protein